MKKSLIALAITAAVSAPAFADTTVYGVLDGGIANITNSGQKSQTLAVSGGLATSRFGVKGSEDLGGGLSAVYTLEYALDAQSNTGIGTGVTTSNSTTAARQQMVGLTGGFGTVATGYLQTSAWSFGGKFDPAGGSDVSAVQNLSNKSLGFMIGQRAAATRAGRALAYVSPTMDGFTAEVDYVTAGNKNTLGDLTVGSNATSTNLTATLVAANYEAGPLAVGGVYASTSNGDTTANPNQKEYALGASYDLGSAKLLSSYQSTKADTTGAAGNSNKLFSLSGVIPAGPGAAVLSYAKATIGTDTTGASDGKSYTGAYLYNLSKTATIYAAYSHVSNGSNTNAFSVDNSVVAGDKVAGVSPTGSTNTNTGSLGGSSSIVAFGLKKSF